MKLSEALQWIDEKNGKIFSIKFVKRTTGETREMVCRQGVTKYLAENPTKPALDFKAHKLVAVYDMAKQAYRSIPIEGIISIKIDGGWVDVEHPVEGNVQAAQATGVGNSSTSRAL